MMLNWLPAVVKSRRRSVIFALAPCLFAGLVTHAAETASVAVVAEESSSVARQNCVRSFEAVAEKSGSVRALNYKKATVQDIETKGQDLFNDLAVLMESKPFADQSYLVTDYFLNYYEPLFELTRKISNAQLATAAGRMPEALKEAQLLMQGESSIHAKVKQLQELVSKKGRWWSVANKAKQVREAADKLKVCKGAIAACALDLPATLISFENEYELYNASKTLIGDEIKILEKLNANVAEGFLGVEESTMDVQSAIGKKIEQLRVLQFSLQAMVTDTKRLVTAVTDVITESKQLNSVELRQAVMQAGAEGIDIADVLEEAEAKAKVQVTKRAEIVETLDVIVNMKDNQKKLSKIINYLNTLKNGDLDLELFNFIFENTPKHLQGLIEDKYLPDAINRLDNNTEWVHASSYPDSVIFLKALRLLNGIDDEKGLFATIKKIQNYIGERYRNCEEDYVVDMKLMFAAEAKKVLK